MSGINQAHLFPSSVIKFLFLQLFLSHAVCGLFMDRFTPLSGVLSRVSGCLSIFMPPACRRHEIEGLN